MVCYGNLCRSPLAHGILASKVNPNNVFVDSAGVSTYRIGSKPDPRAIQVAKNHNIDISNQRYRQLKKSDFHEFDIIYLMDKSLFPYADLVSPTKEHMKKVKLILTEIRTEYDLDIVDPYYRDIEAFEKLYDVLNDVCDVIAKKYTNDLESNLAQ